MSMTDMPSTARRLGTVFLIAVLAMSFAVTPAAADHTDDHTTDDTSGADKNFLCQDGEATSSSEDLVNILQNLVGAFMVIGPVGGIIVALYATVAASAKPSDEGGDYQTLRRNSLLGGFSVPIGAYALQTLSGALLGFDISCIVP